MTEQGPKPPEKRSFWSIITSPFRGLSLPARATLVLSLSLLLVVLIAWTVFFLNPAHVPWRHAMSWTRMASVFVLAFLTCVTFYWSLRIWLIGYRSRFPDIDYAWNAGMTALRRNGISLQSTPVFLILGPPSRQLEETTMDASGREFAVRGVPEGPSPLHWYANAEGIYLVCNEAGWLNRVNRVVHRHDLKTDRQPGTSADETSTESQLG